MDRGRRPVETVPDHGINIGADVTKFQIVASLAHKEQEQQQQQQRHRQGEFLEFLFLRFLELSGLES